MIYAQVLNLARNCSKDLPLLICGDFNNTPDSNAVRYLTEKEGSFKVVPRKQVKEDKLFYYDQVSQKLNSHLEGKMTSAYSHYKGMKGVQADNVTGYQIYTAYTKEESKCIDHIMYSKEFELVSLLEMPDFPYVSDGLPNAIFPSDHMRIEAVLRLN